MLPGNRFVFSWWGLDHTLHGDTSKSSLLSSNLDLESPLSCSRPHQDYPETELLPLLRQNRGNLGKESSTVSVTPVSLFPVLLGPPFPPLALSIHSTFSVEPRVTFENCKLCFLPPGGWLPGDFTCGSDLSSIVSGHISLYSSRIQVLKCITCLKICSICPCIPSDVNQGLLFICIILFNVES